RPPSRRRTGGCARSLRSHTRQHPHRARHSLAVTSDDRPSSPPHHTRARAPSRAVLPHATQEKRILMTDATITLAPRLSPVAFGDLSVGPDEPVYLIGEIGINHNGDVDIAKKL